MKRWVFGYLRHAVHAAAENVQEFRGDPPTHMMRALCDGEWHRYDYADFADPEHMPTAWGAEVRICEACRAKWTPNVRHEGQADGAAG